MTLGGHLDNHVVLIESHMAAPWCWRAGSEARTDVRDDDGTVRARDETEGRPLAMWQLNHPLMLRRGGRALDLSEARGSPQKQWGQCLPAPPKLHPPLFQSEPQRLQ